MRPVHKQIDNLLTQEECMSIRTYFLDKDEWQPATIYTDGDIGKNETVPEHRKGNVMFDQGIIPYTSKLVAAMEQYAARTNIQLIADKIDWQFVKYEVGDHFGEHHDAYLTPTNFQSDIRKVSMTVQLSEPEDYKGGILRVMTSYDTFAHINRYIGTAAIFPSWLEHSVTKVEQGTRYALVAWYRGPFWT